MTRFELAKALNTKLSDFEDEQRRQTIDSYMEIISRSIQDGITEADAINQLCETDSLIKSIIKDEEKETTVTNTINYVKDKVAEGKAYIENTNIDMDKIKSAGATVADSTVNAGKAIADTAVNAGKAVLTGASKTSYKVASAVQNSGTHIKDVSRKSYGILSKIMSLLLKLSMIIFIWLPSVIITILGIICTVALSIIYAFTGIGFAGICIAGSGCCIIGCSFVYWFTQTLMGGKYENN